MISPLTLGVPTLQIDANVQVIGEGLPTIVRQADCQTSSMCEPYCNSGALYVHPASEHAITLDPAPVLARSLPNT